MNILVFNCGSSSQNFKVYNVERQHSLTVRYSGKAHRVGVQGREPSFIEYHSPDGIDKVITPIPDHKTTAVSILDAIARASIEINLIGHRFVHGGVRFQKSVYLTKENESDIHACLPLAPLHNPNSWNVIEICSSRLPHVPQYLTFDTAFHASLAEWAYRYPLPQNLASSYGLRRFGFHGLSYQYVTRQAADYMGKAAVEIDLVACHLGTGGSSVAAIQRGKSLDTSMGYSPLAGLVMSTRPGDLDGLLSVYLMNEGGYDAAALNDLYNKKSGLLGLAGFSSDLRDIQQAVDEGNARAAFAQAVYVERLKKTIAAYITLLGGVDGLIFTDDIGVQNAGLRARVCSGLEWAGIKLDDEKNWHAKLGQIQEIGRNSASTRILSIPTDEERVIADEGLRLMGEGQHVDV